jgi:hypothetical protein
MKKKDLKKVNNKTVLYSLCLPPAISNLVRSVVIKKILSSIYRK